ncbi:MAG: hypothetical protein COB02_08920 [Candidatus Cloacimonadota bacterium]|nr:MAG: hypothetical protein COB02_08920 [Candidatus Cloacimonadota bacterium]
MECRKFDELIQLYIDHSLSNEQKTSFDGHVDSCSRCRDELQGFEKIMLMFGEEDSIKLPNDFTARVMDNLPDLVFKKQSESFGFGFEKLIKYKKVLSLAVASVMMVAVLNFNSPFVPQDIENENNKIITIAKKVDQKLGNGDAESLVKPKKQSILKSDTLLSKLALFVDGGVAQIKTKSGFQIVNKGEFYELGFRDEIRTGANTIARIIYPEDKVRLNLKPNTHMQIAKHSIRLYQGYTWVNVIKKGTRFEVRTPNLIAAVRGTMFSVKSVKNKETTVSVFEGIVRVGVLEDPETFKDLVENEEVSSSTIGLTAKRKVSGGNIDDWYSQLLDNNLLKEGQVSVEKHLTNTEVSPTDSISDEFGK